MPARRNTARNARHDAIAHTSMWIERTGMPEQRGAVGVLRAAPHRDAESGAEEHGEPRERERDHDDRDDVVAAEA